MDINFIKGKAIIKVNKKIVAKVYDRMEFFKGTKYENTFKQFPFSVEMLGGCFECKNFEETKEILNKYL